MFTFHLQVHFNRLYIHTSQVRGDTSRNPFQRLAKKDPVESGKDNRPDETEVEVSQDTYIKMY